MKEQITINIMGDICPTQDNENFIQVQEQKKLFNQVLDILNSGDINITNLEAPLIKKGFRPIDKAGPNLHCNKEFIDLLSKANINIISLANNHICDFGQEGVLNTIKKLNEKGVRNVGAGENIEIAKQPLIIQSNQLKIGIMAFSEHEFNTAAKNSAGANGFDVFHSFDDIKKASDLCDYLIVIFHGGIEYYKYPSPLLQKKCQKMIESGADLVTCQHSHCIGTKEEYMDGIIIYGQGNTIFGYKEGDEDWNRGLLIKLKLSKKNREMEFIPITALKSGGINIIQGSAGENCIMEFEERSRNISANKFVENEWFKFCETKKSSYLPFLFGRGRYFNYINRLSKNGLIDLLYPKRRKMITHNIIRCESHYEVIDTILKNSY